MLLKVILKARGVASPKRDFKAYYYHSSIPVHLGAANSCRPQVPRGHGLSTDFRPLLVAAPTVVWAMPLPERTQDSPIAEECDR